MRDLPFSYIFADVLSCCKKKTKLEKLKALRDSVVSGEKRRLSDPFLEENIGTAEINDVFQDENTKEGIEDPFYRFGLGIFTYLSLLRMLIKLLLFLSIIALFQMWLINWNISPEAQ